MKILVVNPNASEVVLETIMTSARAAASDSTALEGLHAPGGTRNIDSAYGEYMTAPHMIEAVRRRTQETAFDAVVLAGFGNVGIVALRELLDIPVVSIAEASMALACQLGHRFSTLTMLDQFIPYQEDLVRLYGFEAKCASVRAVTVDVEAAAGARETALRDLTSEVRRIIAEDGAEVVVLAHGGLCQFGEDLTGACGVPVVDPVKAGVKTAEGLVAMGLSHSKIRKFNVPPQPITNYRGDLMAREPS